MSSYSKGISLFRHLCKKILGNRQNTTPEPCAGNCIKACMEDFEPRLMLSSAPVISGTSVVALTGNEEGTTGAYYVEFTDADPGDTHTITVHWDEYTTTEASVSPGLSEFYHTYTDDGVFNVYCVISDGTHDTTSTTKTATISNVAPILESESGPDVWLATNNQWSHTLSFSDAGTGDTHSLIVNWGDGSPVETISATTVNGYGSETIAHIYSSEGEYDVNVTVQDDDGGYLTQSYSIKCVPSPTVAELPDTDISIVLAIDVSGSMNEDEFELVSTIVESLDINLENENITVEYGLVTFNSATNINPYTFSSEYFTDGDTIVDTLDILSSGANNANGYDSIEYVLDNYGFNSLGPCRVVVVSDGSENSSVSLQDLLSELEDHNNVIVDTLTTGTINNSEYNTLTNIYAIDTSNKTAVSSYLDDTTNKFLISYNETSAYVSSNTSFVISGSETNGNWEYSALIDSSFVFEDITTSGTSVVNNIETEIELEFSFEFYGVEYNTFTIARDGMIFLGGLNYPSYITEHDDLDADGYYYISDANEEAALIAALWGEYDFNSSENSDVLWEVIDDAAGERLVIQWNNLSANESTSSDDNVTFQLVLHDDTMRMSYLDADTDYPSTDEGANATVGIRYLQHYVNTEPITSYSLENNSAMTHYSPLAEATKGVIISYDILSDYDLDNIMVDLIDGIAELETNSILNTIPAIEITTTNITNGIVTGITDLGGAVMLYANGILIGDTVADLTTGQWSIDIASLEDGQHDLIAAGTDSSGNYWGVSDEATIILDTTAPTVTDVIVNDGDAQRNTVDTISFTISETVNLDGDELEIWYYDNSSSAWTQLDISSATFTYSNGIATWDVSGLLASAGSNIDAHFMAVLSSSDIADGAGNYLDGDNNGAGGDDYLYAFHQLVGDLDGDAVQSSADCDAMLDAIIAGSTSPAYDFDNDLDIDNDDLIVLVENIFNTYAGDVNFDGTVNLDDFIILKQNYGVASGTWAQGDITATDGINLDDFILLKQNYGLTNANFAPISLGTVPAWT